MSFGQNVIFFMILSFFTIVTRFLPFLIFPDGKKIPTFVYYLGRVLPFPVMSMLVVFSLKDVSFVSRPYGLPEIIALLLIVGIHVFKRNSLVSIGAGTLAYMLLVRLF